MSADQASAAPLGAPGGGHAVTALASPTYTKTMIKTTFANHFTGLGDKTAMTKPSTLKKVESKDTSKAVVKTPQRFLDTAELIVTNDPLPAARAAPIHKYHSVFSVMKMGQCVRCPTASVGRVSGAMRKFIEIKRLHATVKSMTRFEDDIGFGRVWLIEKPAKALKVAA